MHHPATDARTKDLIELEERIAFTRAMLADLQEAKRQLLLERMDEAMDDVNQTCIES